MAGENEVLLRLTADVKDVEQKIAGVKEQLSGLAGPGGVGVEGRHEQIEALTGKLGELEQQLAASKKKLEDYGNAVPPVDDQTKKVTIGTQEWARVLALIDPKLATMVTRLGNAAAAGENFKKAADAAAKGAGGAGAGAAAATPAIAGLAAAMGKLGPLVLPVAAALATLVASYKAMRTVIDSAGAKNFFGFDVDEIAGQSSAIEGLGSVIANFSLDLQDIREHGWNPTAAAVDAFRKALGAAEDQAKHFTPEVWAQEAALRAASIAARRGEEAIRALVEAGAGMSVDDFKNSMLGLSGALKNVGGDLSKLDPQIRDEFVDSLRKADAQIVAFGRSILEQVRLKDPKAADELRAALLRIQLAAQDATKANLGLGDSVDAVMKSIVGSREELDRQAVVLVKVATNLKQYGLEGRLAESAAEDLRGRVVALGEQFEKSGEKPPPVFQRLLDVLKPTQEELKKTKVEVDSLRESVERPLAETGVLVDLNKQIEELEGVGVRTQEQIDKLEELKQKASEARSAEFAGRFGSGSDAGSPTAVAAQETQELGEQSEGAAHGVAELARNIVTAGNVTAGFSQHVNELSRDHLEHVNEQVRSNQDAFAGFAREVDLAGGSIERVGDAAGQSGQEFVAAARGAQDLGRDLTEVVEAGTEFAHRQDLIARRGQDFVDYLDDARSSAGTMRDTLDGVNPELFELERASAAAGDGTSSAADALLKFSDSTEGVAINTKKAGEEIDTIPDKVDTMNGKLTITKDLTREILDFMKQIPPTIAGP